MSRHDEEDGPPIPLADLPEVPPPAPDLELRVRARLRAEGLLRRRRSLSTWLVPLAAGLVGIAVGASLRSAPSLAPAEGPLFMFVFSGGPQEGEGLRELVLATGSWARTKAAGRIVSGQRLLPEGTLIERAGLERPAPRPSRDDFTPTGFFVVRARDLSEATALARSNPHLWMGGHLTVRAVDDLRWLAADGG